LALAEPSPEGRVPTGADATPAISVQFTVLEKVSPAYNIYDCLFLVETNIQPKKHSR
jgi:hypothetical protein